jgi:dienelactone hydrolase
MPRVPIATRFVVAAFVTIACHALAVSPARAAAPREIEERRTPAGVRFGLIGGAGNAPAPTLFVFAHAIEVMRAEPVYTEVADLLARQGWACVIVDPPCHGEDARAGEPAQLDGWRHRLERGEDFVAAFNARASGVLDHLIAARIADPARVAACGTSRGGFLAYHFAAAEPRVKAVGGISPVTRLLALREFDGTPRPEQVERLDVSAVAAKLAGRPVWLSIGNNDARVNTDDAIAFTRAVVRAAAPPDRPEARLPVELLVAPAAGHSKVDRAHELLAAWLMEHVPAAPQR